MIHALLIVNNFGRSRLLKFYTHVPEYRQQQIMQELFGVLSSRGEMACNFTDGSAWFPGSRVVYRQYATLYFALLVDAIESELSVLDLIQVIVEVLESRFRNVCELDLVFHSDQAHWLIDEVLVGGLVAETSVAEVVRRAEEKDALTRQQSSELGPALQSAVAATVDTAIVAARSSPLWNTFWGSR